MTGRNWSVRTRLSVLVGGLFLLSGLILLSLTYFLVVANLPETTTFVNSRYEVTALESGVRFQVLPQLEDFRKTALNTMLGQSAAALVLATALAVLFGRIVAGRMLRPVREIATAARRLGADDLSRQRLAMGGRRDELTDLADTFDDMLDRLADAFDSQRRFVANASHELRTPLAVQHTLIEVALSGNDVSPDTVRLGRRLMEMNARSERLIEGLLVLARSDRGLSSTEPVRLDELTTEVLTAHESAEIAFHFESSPLTVVGDSVLLEQLVVNLVQNALRHNKPGGQVWVRVGGEVSLEIANTGPVVPRDAIDSLFEPFLRLSGQRTSSDRGVGLGLSIVASVVAAHGGKVVAEPRAEGGLTVRVTLG
ncbi:HAMP domain-containing sensor histidine kinase [Actinosynnema sp. NPDC023587]|uniref:sensor histidine kinase n=1 Tax=Actinosynnema sp. NPDC023587 TaxID=3154695 RepID=UPI0034105127